VTEIASTRQLWFAWARWAAVTVPFVLLLGLFAGSLSPLGNANSWYRALAKPAVVPPDWVFPVVWTTLYVMMGLALAVVLNARGARLRGPAIAAFLIQFAFNLAWSPVFFGLHRLTLAFYIIIAMLVLAVAATLLFGRIRSSAAWLMLPYLIWISFAGVLNWELARMNPGADGVAAGPVSTQMIE